MADRKVIEGDIPAGEVIEHEGDLHVRGSIGDGVKINLRKGSLIVDHDVGQDCEFDVKADPSVNVSISGRGGSVNIVNGNITISGGNVRIGGISVSSGDDGAAPQGNIQIAGRVGDRSQLNAARSIKAGFTGERVEMKAGDAITVHQDIGPNGSYKAGDSIKAGNIGPGSTLEAGDSIKAERVGDGAELEAGDAIRVGTTGRGVKLDAGDGIRADALGPDNRVDAGDSVKAGRADAGTRISAGDSVKIDAAHASVKARAGDDVKIRSRFNEDPRPF